MSAFSFLVSDSLWKPFADSIYFTQLYFFSDRLAVITADSADSSSISTRKTI